MGMLRGALVTMSFRFTETLSMFSNSLLFKYFSEKAAVRLTPGNLSMQPPLCSHPAGNSEPPAASGRWDIKIRGGSQYVFHLFPV